MLRRAPRRCPCACRSRRSPARACGSRSTCISAARLRATAPLPSTLTTSNVTFGRSKPERIETQSRRPRRARDLLGHPRRGGGGRGHHRRAAERGDRVVQAQVVGAEVVAPLGHAVGLVDDEQPTRRPPAPSEGARGEALGRREHELRLARLDLRAAPARCGRPASPTRASSRARPASRSRRHWSDISAISGLTTTTSGRSGCARRRAPAAGSRATCRRRWASRPGCRGRRAPPARPRAGRAGTRAGRSARAAARASGRQRRGPRMSRRASVAIVAFMPQTLPLAAAGTADRRLADEGRPRRAGGRPHDA